MKNRLPLPQEKKLTIVYRIEPGCLGPNGKDHIIEFCSFAQKEVESIDSDFILWVIEPRYDKAMPETQYKINNKRLTHGKASKYLNIFKKNIDEFEEHLNEKVVHLIDQYLGRLNKH